MTDAWVVATTGCRAVVIRAGRANNVEPRPGRQRSQYEQAGLALV